MKEFISEKWKIDEFKFNILFGFISLLIIPSLNKHVPLEKPTWWVGVIGILIYMSEAWATYYKITFLRAQLIYEKSKGDFHNLSIVPRSPGNTIWFAFLMRLCIRFAIIIFSMMAFGYKNNNDEPSIIIIIVLCCAVLFEIIIMMFTIYETRLYTDISDNDLYPEKKEKES